MAKPASFAAALRSIRRARHLSQEDFSDVSSRTYLSSLERGLKSPTLGKVDQLAATLDIHPLTLLIAAYAGTEPAAVEKALARAMTEIASIRS